MIILVILAGLWILFGLAPAVAVVKILFRRRNPSDFDRAPQRMDGTPYEPWKELILQNIAWMRERPSEQVSAESRDHVVLRGAWYPGGKRTVILSHGYNTTPLNNFAGIARAFLEEGWSVLMIWQRAHGPSGGKIPTFGLKEAEDLAEWIRLAENRGSEEIVLYGISMGGAAVNLTAGKPVSEKLKAMVVDCGYACLNDPLEHFRIPGVPSVLMDPCIRWYVRIRWHLNILTDAYEGLRHAVCPMFFIWGSGDQVVLPDMMRKGYENCGARKACCEVKDAPHTLAFTAGGAEARKALFGFLNDVTGG